MSKKKKKPTAIEALKDYGKIDKDRRLVMSEADLAHENDRGVIIILATNIEDHLEYRIVDAMRGKLSEESVKEVFGLDRTTFNRKIVIAQALGLIDAKFDNKLTLLREIRNVCAHTDKPISFDIPQVRDACLTVVEDLLPHLDGQLRKAFIVECGMIALHVRAGKTISGYEERRRRWFTLCKDRLPDPK